jgi:NAD(P)-dependent dehydrogenase (short-subunit alcohol dehydrogenase family)
MPTKLNLPGKTALITGGAGGIGAAVAAKLAERSTNIVLTDLSQDRLDRGAASLPRASLLAVAADVTDATAMQQVVDAAVERFEHLDVVFANAGVGPDRPSTLRTMDPAVFERVIEVDLLGVWRTIRPALEHIVENQGHVLITASVAAFNNGAVNAPYAACLRVELRLVRRVRARFGLLGGP